MIRRLSLNLEEADAALVDKMAASTSGTATSVLRQAIRLAAWLRDVQEAGGHVMVSEPGRKPVQLRLL